LKFGFALSVGVFLAACAAQQNLSGAWEVRWPDGRQEALSIQDFGGGQWYLKGSAAELNGVYVLKDSALTCVQPDLPAMAGFIWAEGSDQAFTLTEQPGVSRLHDRWLGARLVRGDSK
jgi:hypothetical protein